MNPEVKKLPKSITLKHDSLFFMGKTGSVILMTEDDLLNPKKKKYVVYVQGPKSPEYQRLVGKISVDDITGVPVDMENPYTGRTVTIQRKTVWIRVGRNKYYLDEHNVNRPRSFTEKSIPRTPLEVQDLMMGGGRFVCIIRNKEDDQLDTKNWKVFAGPLENMRPVPIKGKPQILRDGGTVIVNTDSGTITFPTPYSSPKKDNMWGETKLVRYYQSCFAPPISVRNGGIALIHQPDNSVFTYTSSDKK